MTDRMVKGLAYGDSMRVLAIDGSDLVAEATVQHDAWPNAAAALGRTLIGTLLLASSVKSADRLTVQIQGDGPLGRVLATADGDGTVKGYVENPHVQLPENAQGKIDVKGAVGTTGTLSVSKSQHLARPFTGQVALVSGEIAEDLTYYLAQSEQIPSAIGLGVLVAPDGSIVNAGGWMVQVLPGSDDRDIDALEQRIGDIASVTAMLSDGLTPQAMIDALVGVNNWRQLTEQPVAFQCDCDKERFARGLAALPDSELDAMIRDNETIETVCRFCGKKYHFTPDELQAIRDGASDDRALGWQH